MSRHWMNFWKSEDGATAVEYGLIAAIIATVLVGATGSLKSALTVMYSTILTQFFGATS
ncbi:Flp family type IVb pilin [Alsobacter sp. KACC 23698]|uniref:Flp family type IVb pilin n=1 Tax=Alsobacter sp. KACC 23698 TaxID=3149229 RepID=A0AAU7JHC6_9HYPH